MNVIRLARPTRIVNILGGSIHTMRKNTEALLIASKEV
jgi:hypothetical protein